MSYTLRNSNRLTPPSPYMLTSAVNRERDLTALMGGPRADQLVGYRYAAAGDRQEAEADYKLGLEEHNAAVAAQDAEDRRLMTEDRALQRRHSLRNAALSQPLNAALINDAELEEFIPQRTRELAYSLRDAELADRQRRGAGNTGRGSSEPGQITPRDEANMIWREYNGAEARVREAQAAVQRAETAIEQQAARILSTAPPSDQLVPRGATQSPAQQRAEQFRAEAARNLAALREQLRTREAYRDFMREQWDNRRPGGAQQPAAPLPGSTPPAASAPAATTDAVLPENTNITPNGAPLPAPRPGATPQNPVRVQTPEDVRALPPGTYYLRPNETVPRRKQG